MKMCVNVSKKTIGVECKTTSSQTSADCVSVAKDIYIFTVGIQMYVYWWSKCASLFLRKIGVKCMTTIV